MITEPSAGNTFLWCPKCKFRDERPRASLPELLPECTCGQAQLIVVDRFVDVADEGHVHEDAKMVGTRSSKTKRYIEILNGEDWSHKLQRYVYRRRVLNKDENSYFELVFDEQTGEVVHYSEEPLSEHYGHGSARFKDG